MKFERTARPAFSNEGDWDTDFDNDHTPDNAPPRTVDQYLESIRSSGTIEMKPDSKSLAQEAVMEWKDPARTPARLLYLTDKALLIREMMVGAPTAKDSFYIGLLIDDSTDAELKKMISELQVDGEKLLSTQPENSVSYNRVQDVLDPAAKENVVGNRIASNFKNASEAEQKPYGDCYAAARGRFNRAFKDIMAIDPNDITGNDFKPVKTTYYKLWSSQGKNPEPYAAGGGPGAIAMQGWGEMLTHKQIWEEGKLRPGAIIQTWMSEEDYLKVKKGGPDPILGHSFIFLEYVRENNDPQGKITHVKTANQWGLDTFAEHFDYGNYWIGVNITASPPKENLPNAKTTTNVAALLTGDNKINESLAVDKNIATGNKNNLDPLKITAALRNKTTEIQDEKIKTAMLGLNPDRFNIYFAQLVALYQLSLGVKPTGIFDEATCMKLTGKSMADATELKK